MNTRQISDHRTQSKYLLNEARDCARWGHTKSAINHFTLALECLTKSQNMDASDYRQAATICHEFANYHFNKQNYESAASFYNQGAQHLVRIESIDVDLTDSDYRNLAELFIDLSDAYMHLFNQEAAANAFSNAIKAFNLIKNKTDDEKTAEKTNDNYVSFRRLYEAKLSTTSYIKSREFNNHEIILRQNQEDKELIQLVGGVSLSPIIQAEPEIGDLMEGLTITPEPLFSQAPIQREPSDEEYRSMGNQFISLANDQYAKKLINDATKTLEQAISVFHQVRSKSQSDTDMIKHIKEKILQLKNQDFTVHQTPQVSTVGMFARQQVPQSTTDWPTYSYNSNF